MKIIQPMLLAAALLTPYAAMAQNQAAPDRSVDEGATVEETPTERASRTGGTRTEPADQDATRPGMPGTSRDENIAATPLDKHRDEVQGEITDLRRELEDLRANSSVDGHEKLDTLATRLNDLEARTMSASDDRVFNENKHKFKNEIKKIKKELKGARKYRTATPDSQQSAPMTP